MKKAELGKTRKGCQQALFLKREIAERKGRLAECFVKKSVLNARKFYRSPELELFEEILFKVRGEGVQTQHQSSQPRQPPHPPTILTFWHLHHSLSR